MAREPTGKELTDAFNRMLPHAIEQFERIIENFPFPPGKEYRARARKYRQEMYSAIRAGEKAVEKLAAERAKKKAKQKQH